MITRILKPVLIFKTDIHPQRRNDNSAHPVNCMLIRINRSVREISSSIVRFKL